MQKELTGRDVLLIILAFFGVIIVANTIFISLALKSFPGESQEKPYWQGLHYNDVLANRKRQQALGWQVKMRDVTVGNPLIIEISDADGNPLSGLLVEGAIKRPTHDKKDHAVHFEGLGNGLYQVRSSTLAKGVWDLSAEVYNADGDVFSFTARMSVQ